jgi:hypothetical protein
LSGPAARAATPGIALRSRFLKFKSAVDEANHVVAAFTQRKKPSGSGVHNQESFRDALLNSTSGVVQKKVLLCGRLTQRHGNRATLASLALSH